MLLLSDYDAEIKSQMRDGAAIIMSTRIAIPATSTLSGAILSSDVALTLIEASGFPPAGGPIAIESEKLIYGPKNANQLSKLLRGQDGTVAAGHASGVAVAMRNRTLLQKALEIYSKKMPADVVVYVESDGTGDFSIASLTGFVEQVSGEPVIEYPIAEPGASPNYIDRREWTFYRKPAGLFLRMPGVPIGGMVGFSFKGAHSVNAIASTVPDSDFSAVCKLGAAEGLSELATHFSQSTENSYVNADVANYQSKADQYARRAKQLRMEANEQIGAGSDELGVGAASVTTNLDVPPSYGGDRITHPKWRR